MDKTCGFWNCSEARDPIPKSQKQCELFELQCILLALHSYDFWFAYFHLVLCARDSLLEATYKSRNRKKSDSAHYHKAGAGCFHVPIMFLYANTRIYAQRSDILHVEQLGSLKPPRSVGTRHIGNWNPAIYSAQYVAGVFYICQLSETLPLWIRSTSPNFMNNSWLVLCCDRLVIASWYSRNLP